jgi:hypothetical protein
MRNKALLLGNGINNIGSAYTWKDLVKDLVKKTGAAGIIDPSDHKPFPLLYEEIYLDALRKKKMKEHQVKAFICSKTQKMRPNRIHYAAMNMGFGNLLTTNYDHCLEQAAPPQGCNLDNHGKIKESLYSLFRHFKSGRTKIWHIHGECSSTRTITLGYDHYSGYLQRMRNYVVNGTDELYKTRFKALIRRWPKLGGDSWIDLFFTHSIYIIGLTLDFVEMHLWWLLTFRARWKLEQNKRLTNTITYFYPRKLENAIRHKLELFRSVDVQTIAVEALDCEDHYLDILKSIGRKRPSRKFSRTFSNQQ